MSSRVPASATPTPWPLLERLCVSASHGLGQSWGQKRCVMTVRRRVIFAAAAGFHCDYGCCSWTGLLKAIQDIDWKTEDLGAWGLNRRTALLFAAFTVACFRFCDFRRFAGVQRVAGRPYDRHNGQEHVHRCRRACDRVVRVRTGAVGRCVAIVFVAVCTHNKTIAEATAKPAKEGKFVLTLGGDHSIAMGSISYVRAG